MLVPLFGSENSERALLFLLARNEGYPREIARFFGTNLYAVQRQLDKLEAGGILVSRTAGRTRLYQFNPRFPFLPELKQFVEKKLSTGTLKIISPTDCVKDRFAAYYHWGDQQSLLQATL